MNARAPAPEAGCNCDHLADDATCAFCWRQQNERTILPDGGRVEDLDTVVEDHGPRVDDDHDDDPGAGAPPVAMTDGGREWFPVESTPTKKMAAGPIENRHEIETREGTVVAEEGDYLIREDDGNVYPISAEKFGEYYRRVETDGGIDVDAVGDLEDVEQDGRHDVDERFEQDIVDAVDLAVTRRGLHPAAVAGRLDAIAEIVAQDVVEIPETVTVRERFGVDLEQHDVETVEGLANKCDVAETKAAFHRERAELLEMILERELDGETADSLVERIVGRWI